MTTATETSHLIYLCTGDNPDGMGGTEVMFACSSMADAKFRLFCFWVEDYLNAEAEVKDISPFVHKDDEDIFDCSLDGLGYTITQMPCWD